MVRQTNLGDVEVIPLLEGGQIALRPVTSEAFARFLNGRVRPASYRSTQDDALLADFEDVPLRYTDGAWSASEGSAPMVQVTFAGARDYCEAAAGRLPTLLEWQAADSTLRPPQGMTTFGEWTADRRNAQQVVINGRWSDETRRLTSIDTSTATQAFSSGRIGFRCFFD